MFWRLIIILWLCFTSVASDEQRPLKKIGWPFDGFFGKIDRQAAQRGFQVYKEVCSACHAMSHLSYRNLKNIGFSDEEIKEIAQNYFFIQFLLFCNIFGSN
jgi:ubiquinol-cytochrome c reductase cytochrome c1 subunit